MRSLKTVIASHQRGLRDHALFDLLAAAQSTEPLAAMARALAWWPMVFQDVLRLNLDQLRGTEFERFAEYHQNEDAGHDRWYIDDLSALGVDLPGLEDLFGGSYQALRETCYSLVAEVLRQQTPAQRVALLLALEPTGHVFFESISAAVDRICPSLPLRYFARSHLSVEKGHDLFAESTDAELERVVLTEAERAGSEETVARIYRAFEGLFSYLSGRMQEGGRAVSYVRALAPSAYVGPRVRDATGS